MKGVIASWNAERYFGFISSSELKNGNLFFHGSAILFAPDTVAVGNAVEFTPDHDRTGRPRAINVRVIDLERQTQGEPQSWIDSGNRRGGQILGPGDRQPVEEDQRKLLGRNKLRRDAEKLWTHEGDR